MPLTKLQIIFGFPQFSYSCLFFFFLFQDTILHLVVKSLLVCAHISVFLLFFMTLTLSGVLLNVPQFGFV